MKQITVCLCIAASYLSASLPVTPAQSAGTTTVAAQSAPSPEAARIDEIIKEIRSLLSEGKFDEVDQKAEEALTLARQIGDKARQSRLYSQLGTAAVHQGKKDLARDHFKHAVLLAAQAGDNNLQSLYLHSAAVLLAASGAYDEAQSFFNQSLALRRKLNDRRGQALTLATMSDRKLIIVADGSLLYLPFETLARGYKSSANDPMNIEYLIDRFAISYAPSATALAAIKERSGAAPRTSKGIIAFGDPIYVNEKAAGADSALSTSRKPLSLPSERGFDFKQLPYTRTEVNGIASLFSADERRTFLGVNAQEETVKTEDLSRYRYVHFAAHGMIDEQVPARSGIVLSAPGDSKEDSILQMSEVMRLKLNAELVTLSACRTGLGKLLKGEGMIGLTRAFMYAGADSVLVSLWSVNDLATAELMKSFYQHLKQGEKKDAALRRAKLSMIRGRRLTWRHPYYWAPFTLIGQNN